MTTALTSILEDTLGRVGLARREQFGKDDEAVREGLAYVIATSFQAQHMLRLGKEYEYEVMVCDLQDMWQSLREDMVRIRLQNPPTVWN